MNYSGRKNKRDHRQMYYFRTQKEGQKTINHYEYVGLRNRVALGYDGGGAASSFSSRHVTLIDAFGLAGKSIGSLPIYFHMDRERARRSKFAVVLIASNSLYF